MTLEEPEDAPPWGWMGFEHAVTGEKHIVPTWDLGPHVLGAGCACGPTEDPGWIGFHHHRSFDGREDYECGCRKRH